MRYAILATVLILLLPAAAEAAESDGNDKSADSDPFTPWVVAAEPYDPNGPVTKLSKNELDLTGFLKDVDAGDKAMFMGPDGKGYILGGGDSVLDGTLIEINRESGKVRFSEGVIDRPVWYRIGGEDSETEHAPGISSPETPNGVADLPDNALVKKILREQERLLSGEQFSYNDGVSEPRMAEPRMAELLLVGIVTDLQGGHKALFMGSRGKVYSLGIGDSALDGTLLEIDPGSGTVIFRRTDLDGVPDRLIRFRIGSGAAETEEEIRNSSPERPNGPADQPRGSTVQEMLREQEELLSGERFSYDISSWTLHPNSEDQQHPGNRVTPQRVD